MLFIGSSLHNLSLKEVAMPKYTVIAKMTTHVSTIVEAKDADEAWDIARDIDGGEFVEINENQGDQWSIYSATEIEE